MERHLMAINAEAVAAAQAAALPDDYLRVLVETFQALADPTRARMLHALTQQPLCVRDLAIVADISESATSHQLRFLRERRLVRAQRAGNVMNYMLDDQHVVALFQEAAYHVDHVRRGLSDHPYPRNEHKET